MKSRYLSTFLVFLLVVLLSGCACSHEWIAEDCVNAQTCAKCQEVGAAALGHAWLDATCTEAEICTRCGASRGEALGHSYGEWVFREDQMTHTCSACEFEETMPLDREVYLEKLLAGHWDFFGMRQNGSFTFATQLDFVNVHLLFEDSRSVTLNTPDAGALQGTWDLDSYKQEDGNDIYNILLHCGENVYPVWLRYRSGNNKDIPEKTLVMLAGQQEIFLSQYDSGVKKLAGSWSVQNTEWGLPAGNLDNWITLCEDRTVTGYLNGTVEGVWHLVPAYTNSASTPSSYGIVIENRAGEKVQLFQGAKNGDSLRVRINRGWQTFGHTSESVLDAVKLSRRIHLNKWTSTTVEYRGEVEKFTTEYSVTFHEDGTFTAKLGKDLNGTWTFREYTDSNDPEDDKKRIYRYFMYADGLEEEIYCEVDARLHYNQFIIYNCPLLDERQIMFRQLETEDAELFMKWAYQPVGTWVSQDPENNDSITFEEDLTFSGTFDGEEISGMWYYRDYYFDPEEYYSDPENNAETYRRNVDGSFLDEFLIQEDVIYIDQKPFCRAE